MYGAPTRWLDPSGTWGNLSPQISLNHGAASSCVRLERAKEETLPAKYNNPNKIPRKREAKRKEFNMELFNLTIGKSTGNATKSKERPVSGSAVASSTCFGEDVLIS